MSNSWWEIKLTCLPSWEEDLFWRLSEFGCKGVAVTKNTENSLTIAGYLPKIQVEQARITDFFLALEIDAMSQDLTPPTATCTEIEEEDWSSSWKEHWTSQAVGSKLLIHPAWLPEPATSDRLLLKLDPGVAFGTGTHATTQLCLEALEMRVRPGFDLQVADIGCGSGILSTAAVLLGAKAVYAVDNDPLAVKATAENRDLNGISADRLSVVLGSVEQLQMLIPAPVDGIVCNILAEPIINMAPYFAALVKPKGWAILSGLISDQVAEVSAAMEKYGWNVGAVWRTDDWSCINLKRG
jgi:ribosomal protein L11 methyltransferase